MIYKLMTLKLSHIKIEFLRSKVAQRIFFLFVICSLLPVCIFAFFSIQQVSSELNRKARSHLRQTSKITGLSIYTRLLILENELTSHAQQYLLKNQSPRRELLTHTNLSPFTNITIIDSEGNIDIQTGIPIKLPLLNIKEQNQINKSSPVLLSFIDQSQNITRLFIALAIDQNSKKQKIIYGLINPDFLWGVQGEDILPSENEEIVIFDKIGNTLFSTLPDSVTSNIFNNGTHPISWSGYTQWEHNNLKYLSSSWSLFLEHHFAAGQWSIIATKSSKQIFTPIEHSKKFLTLLLFLTICMVSLLSIRMIRNNMVPIDRLKEMTIRIANGNFTQPVVIKSADEFEDLGNSFNNMAGEINRQQEILKQAEQKSKTLSARLLDAQENERKNISKELHDDLGQLLTAVLLDIGNALSISEEKQTELKPTLDRIQSGTFETLTKIRNISAALRPGALDHLGLEAATRAMLLDFNERSEITFRGSLDTDDRKIPEAIGIAIYRILQETITNIIKHSGADDVYVDLNVDEGKISLTIKDNGQGFDIDNLPQDKGIGLLGMAERMEALSGEFHINSAPGEGTEIIANCPL